jgi:hypothetical protein
VGLRPEEEEEEGKKQKKSLRPTTFMADYN